MKLKNIENKIAELQNGVFIVLPGQDKKKIIKSYSIAKDKLILTLAYGYGLNEEKETVEMNLFEFGDWVRTLQLFTKPTGEVTPKEDNPAELSQSNKNNIEGLREHLFRAIRELEGGTMNVAEAKAMASVAQTIINSAKLELEYKRMAGKTSDMKLLEE